MRIRSANLGGGKDMRAAGASSSKGTINDSVVFFAFFFGGPLHNKR
jgi:hypothetical protein